MFFWNVLEAKQKNNKTKIKDPDWQGHSCGEVEGAAESRSGKINILIEKIVRAK
jgi:hypothetical protein